MSWNNLVCSFVHAPSFPIYLKFKGRSAGSSYEYVLAQTALIKGRINVPYWLMVHVHHFPTVAVFPRECVSVCIGAIPEPLPTAERIARKQNLEGVSDCSLPGNSAQKCPRSLLEHTHARSLGDHISEIVVDRTTRSTYTCMLMNHHIYHAQKFIIAKKQREGNEPNIKN